MKTKIMAVAAALCLLAGSGAYAQNVPTPRMKERPTPEQMAQQRTERMTERLGLNQEQAKQLYDLNLQQIKEMQAQREQMRTARQAHADRMKAILTPEQFTKWQDMQGRRSNRPGRDGKRGQNGPGPDDCCNGRRGNR